MALNNALFIISLLPCICCRNCSYLPIDFLKPLHSRNSNILVLKEALTMSIQYVHCPCKGRNNTKIMWLALDWCYLGTMYKDR